MSKKLSRRRFLMGLGTLAAGSAVAACQPKTIIVKETVEVEKQVEKVVKETVVVEKEKIVVEEKEVTKVVEKEKLVEVTVTPVPLEPAHVVMMYNANELSDDEIALFNDKHAPYSLERVDTDLTAMYSMLAAGTQLDLYRLYGTFVPAHNSRHIIKDLTPYFDISDILKPDDLFGVNDLFVDHGNRYGMVKDWSPDVSIYVNKSLWEEAGVTPPEPGESWHLTEWRELSNKLTVKEGDQTLVWGTDFTPNEHFLFWLTTTFDPPRHLFTDDFSQVVLLDDPDTYEVIKFWLDWKAEGGLPSALNPHIAGWSGQDWVVRGAATVMWGYWFSGMAESEDVPGEDISMLPAPKWGPNYSNPCVTGCGAVVTSTTKVPDAAWKVFEWFMGEEPSDNRAKSGWGVPGLKSQVDLMPREEPWRQQTFELVQWEVENSTVPRMTYSPFIDPDAFKAAWNKYEEAVLREEMVLDEMLETVEAEVNEAIQEGMERAGVA